MIQRLCRGGLVFGGNHEGIFLLPSAEAGFHVGDVGVAHFDKGLPCQGSSTGTPSMGDDAGALVRHLSLNAALDASAGEEGCAFDVALGPFVRFSNVKDYDLFASCEPVVGFLLGYVWDGLLGGLYHLLSYVFQGHSPFGGVAYRSCIKR